MAEGRKTGGRQKGTPNKATAAVRDVFSGFVEANVEKAQELFDRVAESDPAKALDLPGCGSDVAEGSTPTT